MMKKVLIIGGSVIGFILLLLLSVNIFGPGIARRYVVKHSKELVGRQVQVQNIRLNVFSGKVRVLGLEMLEQNGKDVFASIDTLEVRVRLRKLLGKELYVKKISVVHPKIVILQNESKFNFSDLLEGKKDSSDTTKSSFTYSFNNITIKSGNLYYKDLTMNGVWDLRSLDLFVPSVYFGGENTDIGLEFRFGTGGYFTSKNEYNIKTGRYILDVALRDMDIKTALPYAKKFLKLKDMGGKFSCSLKINGDANHVTNFVLSGNAGVKGFNLIGADGKPLVEVDTANVAINSIDSQKGIFKFSEVGLHGANLYFYMKKDGNNFTNALVPQEPQATAKSDTVSAPLSVQIERIAVDGVNFTFNDNTLQRPFNYNISKIDVESSDFAMNKSNRFEMSAALPGGGTSSALFNGKFDDIANLVLNIKVNNLDLKYLSPYVESYTAFPITGGALSFSSENTIRNYTINAENKLDIVKVVAGNKIKNLKPEYHVPLKTALYIIQDREGKASFDVPVTGNIKSPQFSYKRIVIKTLVNLLIKVVAAPVDILGEELGLKNDIPSSIAMDFDQTTLTTEQHVVLGDLAKILSAKPDLKLILSRAYDSSLVKEQVALKMAKTNFYIHQNHIESNKLSSGKQDQAERISESDPRFLTYVDSLAVVKNGSLSQKTLSIFSNSEISEHLKANLAVQRATIIGYLVNALGVSSDRVSIDSDPVEKISPSGDKITYSIRLSVDNAD